MAISVDTVYKTVLLILNKEQRGYMTPDDFNKIFSKLLIGQSDNFIQGYRSYYSSYSLWADTKAYRNNLPFWRTPWKKTKKPLNEI
jgi:hypothetical protein